METITWEEYLIEDHPYKLIDIDTIPVPLKHDYMIRNHNVRNWKLLCARCSGTGNHLMFKYQRCTDCNGKGCLE